MNLWSPRERALLVCVLRVVPWLAAGAIVNVAVAWACLRLPIHFGVSSGIGGFPIYDTQGKYIAMAHTAVLRGAGLPLRTLKGTGTFPHDPLWPGFAINTIFYAAILWLLFAAPFALRRRIRARRGQCQACAYPVGASEVCTECGMPVTPRA